MGLKLRTKDSKHTNFWTEINWHKDASFARILTKPADASAGGAAPGSAKLWIYKRHGVRYRRGN
jgi:hypothetical protein